MNTNNWPPSSAAARRAPQSSAASRGARRPRPGWPREFTKGSLVKGGLAIRHVFNYNC